MKFMVLLIKNIKEIVRDHKNLFLLLLFPAIFMIVFAVAFGSISLDDTTVDVGIINLDEGVNGQYYSNDLINTISDAELNNSEKIFNIVNLTNESMATEKLQDDTLQVIMIIPDDYSENIINLQNPDYTGNLSNIVLKGDPTSTHYIIAQGILNNLLLEYSNKIQNQSYVSSKTIGLQPEGIDGTSSFTQFDYIAPGLIVFAILMTVTSVTSNISKETEDGMLRRLKISNMKSKDYVLSNIISWSLIGAIQVIILLVVAVMLDFHWQGGLNSIILVAIIGILTTISSVGLSIIIVSITKSSNQATSLATIISVPLSFICGSFFPLPDATIFNLYNHNVQLYELLPWNQAITSFRNVLIYGADISNVWINLVLIIFMGFIILTISTILFNHKIGTEE